MKFLCNINDYQKASELLNDIKLHDALVEDEKKFFERRMTANRERRDRIATELFMELKAARILPKDASEKTDRISFNTSGQIFLETTRQEKSIFSFLRF